MICERCKKSEANYYYKENVNGTERSYHLCTECAKALEAAGELKSFTPDNLFGGFGTDGLTSLFSSLFAPVGKQNGSKTGRTLPEQKKCTLCGAGFDDLVREGKAGCPKCYEVFAEELAESIRRIHGRSAHTGKEPAAFREKNRVKRKLEQLEVALKDAIQSENYERAAELRDEIRALKAKEEADGNA